MNKTTLGTVIRVSIQITSFPLCAMAQLMVSQQDRDRLIAEIDAINRLYEDTKSFLEDGLRNPNISQEDFAEGAMRAMRLLIRLKVMLDDYEKL